MKNEPRNTNDDRPSAQEWTEMRENLMSLVGKMEALTASRTTSTHNHSEAFRQTAGQDSDL